MPPSPLEWLPEGHLAYFVLELVETIDLSAINAAIQEKDGRGERPYPPAMMVALLLYGYAVGVYSSRKIARATHEDVAFRVLAGGAHPHFTTINEFRNRYRAEYAELFKHVLKLCRAAGMVSLGHIAIDGTKLNANASKHKAMSYERMQEDEQWLTAEIEELLKKAEALDREEDRQFGAGKSGEDLPKELQLRESRLKKVREAKAALEKEAAEARAQQLRENAAGMREKAADATVNERERKAAATRAAKSEKQADALSKDDSDDEPKCGGGTSADLPTHRVSTELDGTPKPKSQRNFTDPDSRIMMRNTEVVQAFNAQIAVDAESQVIVAEGVSNQPPDAEYFEPMLERIVENCDGDAPIAVSADNGYLSKAAIDAAKRHGVNAHLAFGREEKAPKKSPTTEALTPAQKARAAMRRKLGTPTGKAIYARRKCIVEPAFGQIKEARRFRRFSMRGLPKVRDEWTLVCLTHNLLKLFRSLGSLDVLALRLATS